MRLARPQELFPPGCLLRALFELRVCWTEKNGFRFTLLFINMLGSLFSDMDAMRLKETHLCRSYVCISFITFDFTTCFRICHGSSLSPPFKLLYYRPFVACQHSLNTWFCTAFLSGKRSLTPCACFFFLFPQFGYQRDRPNPTKCRAHFWPP